MNTEKKRYDYIDILRIIGCLLVIYIHTLDHGYHRYSYSYPGPTWIWDFFLSDLAQTGVPLFLAISGAMLLGKEETIKQTYKRIPKFLFDLIFFSTIYICLETRAYGKPIIPSEIITRMIGDSYFHIWYLYIYIAFIITLPILRPMVKGLTQKTGIYLLIVATLFAAVIPIAQLFGLEICYRINPTWVTMIIFIYPVEGYIIDKLYEIDKIGKKQVLNLIIIAVFCFIIELICGSYFFKHNPNTLNETFLTNFNIVKVAALFILTKKICYTHKLSPKAHTLISEIGKCTFGIYLIHYFILDRRPIKYLWYAIYDSSWGHYVGCYISCIGTFLIGCLIIYVCRKIPLIKKMF